MRGESGQALRAVVLSALMILSVLGGTVAFAGSAAGNVQDFDGLVATDVQGGPSSVTQTVTLQGLENDDGAATITISNGNGDLGNAQILDVRQVSDNGHDVTSANPTTGSGDITIELAASSGATGDLVLEVDLDVSAAALQGDSVTYTATGDGIIQTDTFDISVAQPAVASAVIPAANPDTVEVRFDTDIAVSTPGSVADAFTLANAAEGITVTGLKSDAGDTATLQLSDKIPSTDTGLTIAYDGTNNDNPIVDNGDNDVVAADIDPSVGVTNNAKPTFESAVVTDGAANDLVVTFSEEVQFSGTDVDVGIGNSFTIGDSRVAVAQSGPVIARDSTSVTLNLASDLSPGADLTQIDYTGADGGDVIQAADGSPVMFDFNGQTASNDVVPSITSAEVITGNPGQILVSYDGDIQSAGPQAADDFTFDGQQSVVSVNFGAGGSTDLAVVLDSDITAADGSPLPALTYEQTGGDGGASVESTSGTAALSTDSVAPDNGAAPTFVSAEVAFDNPGQVAVTFSAPVDADVGDGNIDSAVTEAFEFSNSATTLRVKNVESGLGTSTVTLNFGENDGTAQTVGNSADLTDVLSYDPNAPTGDEVNPLIADGGTDAAVQSFDDEDVTNNLALRVVSAVVPSTADELRVEFSGPVIQVGTDSKVVNEFTVRSDALDLDGSSVVLENENTIVFSDFGTNTLNSATDLTSNTKDLEIEAIGLGTFTNVDITNNIRSRPTIESAEVTDANPSQIAVTYDEDITGSDEIAFRSFTLSGNNAPTITGQSADSATLTLELASTVSSGDTLGTLSYAGGTDGQEVISGGSGSGIGLDGDSVSVTNSVVDNPILLSAVVDDAPANNDGGTTGEMVLTFDSAVTIGNSQETLGLAFDANNDLGVSVTIDSVSVPNGIPNNKVIATFSSDSGSVLSSIQQDDDLTSAVLEVNRDAVGITGVAGDPLANIVVEDVRNEIAGDPATIDSITVGSSGTPSFELIGTDFDEKGGFTVTVTGVSDAQGNRVIATPVQVDIGGVKVTVDPVRFADSASSGARTPTGISKDDVEIGVEATADVTGATVTDAATVTFVHEAFTQDAGFELVSQPMPGTFVAGAGIDDISYYEADAGSNELAFESYGSATQVERVHNALFVNAASAGAEYGFAYDEDRSGQQTNVGTVNMGVGWHILGSNFDISNSDIDLSDDLATLNDPSSAEIDVQLTSLPGTTLGDTDTVGDNAAYYVFVNEEDNRAIVLPAYSGTLGDPSEEEKTSIEQN